MNSLSNSKPILQRNCSWRSVCSDLSFCITANHCRRPRYIKALARGGKRFDLNGRFKGEVTAEEQQIAQNHPCMQTNKAEAAVPAESTDAASADVKEADNN